MLKGMLRVLDDPQTDRLHDGILNVLARTGLHIRGEFLLRALAHAGCRVDFAPQRDRYRMVRSSLWYPFCRDMPPHSVSWPERNCSNNSRYLRLCV